MKRIIEVDPKLDSEIIKIVHKKGYEDFQRFATIALENQLIAETDEVDSWKVQNQVISQNELIKSSETAVYSTTLYTKPVLTEIRTLEMPNDDVLVGKILWGQFYRFLPVKFATRVLANLSSDRFPTIAEFVSGALSSATSLRKILIKIDKRAGNEFGEKISAGFPDMSEKSKRRFEQHFLISTIKSASKLDGMLTRLKFANIKLEDGDEFIGLTQEGLQFAELHSYVLDDSKPPSLSEEEVMFLLHHIYHNLTNEYNHIRTILNLIKTKDKTREALNISLRSYYEEYFSGSSWSDAVVNTMRAGSLGRLIEMGLVKRNKKGRNVSYSLTDLGDDVTKRKYRTDNSPDTGGEQDSFSCVHCGGTHDLSEHCAV